MPSFTSSAVFGLLAVAAKVSAHGFVDSITADGVSYIGYLVNSYPYQASVPESVGWSETSTDLGFVAPSQFATGDIICHNGAKNAALSAPVAAGSIVDLHWNTWPESHKGPVLNYLANCGGSCATVDKSTLKFFKISEVGFSAGTWASDALMANNLTGSVTIPATIAPGNYVLRHEMIALHSAGQADGAQSYPFCVNLEVSGTGTDAPEGVLGTALYTPTEAGILVSIYNADLAYYIPGPALISAGGSGPGAPATPATPATPSSSAPAAAATPSTPAAPASPSAPASSPAPVEEDESCE